MKVKLKNIWFPILLAILLIVAFFFATYYILNQEVTSIVISYIDELSAHDMEKITDFLYNRWESMESIYREFQLRQTDSIDSAMDKLNILSNISDFDLLCFVDEAGNLYSSKHIIHTSINNEFTSFLQGKLNTEKFVAPYTEKSISLTDDYTEYMLYGLRFSESPIVIEDPEVGTVRFNALLVLNDISKIREKLRITCFNNRGYTSIVSYDGTIIVPGIDFSADDGHDFFEHISEKSLEKGITITTIKEDIETVGRTSFWCDTTEQVAKFISIQKIKNFNWYFVTVIEKTVFSEQMRQFIFVTTTVLALLAVFALIIVYLSSKIRKRLKNFYASVADGVQNRQYYNDKVVDAHVHALAIVDIDHLKSINDLYGHIAGDIAIKEMALILVRNVGKLGTICRFGGDEFVVVCPNEITQKDFLRALQGSMEEVRRLRFSDYPNLKVSFSIGGCFSEGTGHDVLAMADRFLYKAKKTRDALVTNLDSDSES